MKVFDKIISLFKDGIIKQTGDLVDRFVVTGEDKQRFKNELLQLNHKIELEAVEMSLKAEQEFNQRVKDLEGTAADLQRAGFIGKFVLFLRGAQRPLWGYFLGFMDYKVFSGGWDLAGNDKLESAFWIVNFLVLGFLFGERAIKNVAPLVSEMMKKKTP